MARAVARPVVRVDGGTSHCDPDLVAREAPLTVELRSAGTGETCVAGVLMRTPGDDDDLVRGWLYTERLIADLGEIAGIDGRDSSDGARDDRAIVTVASSVSLGHLIEHRSLTPTSACGLCGRVAIDRLDSRTGAADGGASLAARWPTALIAGLPAALSTAQTVFAATGGLHAAGLFDHDGSVQFVREDVGRHNAVDKVIGAAIGAGTLRDRCAILVVSGRVAFEIVQKAAVGGQAAVVAVGAPSDLAVDAARAAGLTLVGFARDGRFNVYAGAERIDAPRAPATEP